MSMKKKPHTRSLAKLRKMTLRQKRAWLHEEVRRGIRDFIRGASQ
jgi:hypothetical protein